MNTLFQMRRSFAQRAVGKTRYRYAINHLYRIHGLILTQDLLNSPYKENLH
ncbi:hypothetical protein H6G94_19745 [Nostoc punctiforme FACHB-252]|uniref:Transposase n=1 Tax=Nostoc punctiforme FACHB-252 TaxID=1357509 RepID=A0ABR8HE69_NOSPU|nr:hypothetical protein [Nostoc punctiforme]MBD2613480.1 hypothetical protein [Nostoc punctiforme FACHB-252]